MFTLMTDITKWPKTDITERLRLRFANKKRIGIIIIIIIGIQFKKDVKGS